MKTLEPTIMSAYVNTFERPTLRQLSSDSQINMTRIFRLLNGAQMKVSEYETINARLKARLGLQDDTLEEFIEDLKLMPKEWIEQIQSDISKKKRLLSLITK